MIGRVCLAVLASVGLFATGAAARSSSSATERNRAVLQDFAHRFYDLRHVREAFERHVAPDYIQHNPNIPDGREAAIAALVPIFSAEGSRFDVKRIIVDGDYAVIHLRGRSGAQGEGGAVADVYRLKNGKIVEHWDVLQPIADKTINPHPYF